MNIEASALRMLSVDMVEKAGSGHPGMPLGMADIALVLFKHFLKFNPNDPTWQNRDRLIISNGHGSALLYAALYLSGYKKMTLEHIQNFRRLNSICAGHPELDQSVGVETNTGPLGQGIATAVGIALAERIANAKFGDKLVDHKTYVFCGDGCLAEGIGQEAIVLAGHYRLKNLIILFDDNGITIDGSTELSTSDDHIKRFEAAGFETYSVDGHSETQLFDALKSAQKADKPVFIACKTVIGLGAGKKAGTENVHGAALGLDAMQELRKYLNWSWAPFETPQGALDSWRGFWVKNKPEYDEWQAYYKNHGSAFAKFLSKETLEQAQDKLQEYTSTLTNDVNEASRVSGSKALDLLMKHSDNFIVGSADLAISTGVKVGQVKAVDKNNYNGNFIHFGEREHVMAAAMNGLSLWGGFLPVGGTFLVFSDYARPAIRLSAMMKRQVVYMFTHDSIGLGEDGPTHQPVEHLVSLRAIPGLNVFRPADVVETMEVWELALSNINSPSILSLTRQNLKRIRRDVSQNMSSFGAYIIKEFDNDLMVTIFATGSEVQIALKAAEILEQNSIGTRVVSAPCIELFFKQDPEYVMSLTCNNSLKVGVEAATRLGWERLIGVHGLFFGVEEFGYSAPAADLYKYFGITEDMIAAKIKTVLKAAAS